VIILLEDSDMKSSNARAAAEDIGVKHKGYHQRFGTSDYDIGGVHKVFMARYIIHVPHQGEAKVIKSRDSQIGINGIIPEDIAEKFKKMIALDAMERL